MGRVGSYVFKVLGMDVVSVVGDIVRVSGGAVAISDGVVNVSEDVVKVLEVVRAGGDSVDSPGAGSVMRRGASLRRLLSFGNRAEFPSGTVIDTSTSRVGTWSRGRR